VSTAQDRAGGEFLGIVDPVTIRVAKVGSLKPISWPRRDPSPSVSMTRGLVGEAKGAEDFCAVQQAVGIRVWVIRIGAVDAFQIVGQAVTIAILPRRGG